MTGNVHGHIQRGVNFGRRSPPIGGQFSTLNNSRADRIEEVGTADARPAPPRYRDMVRGQPGKSLMFRSAVLGGMWGWQDGGPKTRRIQRDSETAESHPLAACVGLGLPCCTSVPLALDLGGLLCRLAHLLDGDQRSMLLIFLRFRGVKRLRRTIIDCARPSACSPQASGSMKSSNGSESGGQRCRAPGAAL